MSQRKTQIRKIVFVAIFAGLSYLLYLFPKINLPIFPGFLDIQFSNVPAILGGLILGPLYGSLIVIVRALLKLPFTTSAGIGELADLMIGLAVVVTSSIYYEFRRNKKGGIIALFLATIVWIGMAVITNRYMLMPFYIANYGFDAVIGMMKMINGITESNFYTYYILYAVIPFNLILSLIVNLITLLIYKKVSVLIKKRVDE